LLLVNFVPKKDNKILTKIKTVEMKYPRKPGNHSPNFMKINEQFPERTASMVSKYQYDGQRPANNLGVHYHVQHISLNQPCMHWPTGNLLDRVLQIVWPEAICWTLLGKYVTYLFKMIHDLQIMHAIVVE